LEELMQVAEMSGNEELHRADFGLK